MPNEAVSAPSARHVWHPGAQTTQAETHCGSANPVNCLATVGVAVAAHVLGWCFSFLCERRPKICSNSQNAETATLQSPQLPAQMRRPEPAIVPNWPSSPHDLQVNYKPLCDYDRIMARMPATPIPGSAVAGLAWLSGALLRRHVAPGVEPKPLLFGSRCL